MLRYWHWCDYTTRLPSRCTISVYQMFLTFRYIYFFFHQVVQGLLFEKFFQIHFRFEMCTIDVTVINFCWLSGLFANPVIHLQHPTPLAMPHTGHVSFFVFIRIKSKGTWLWLLQEEITRTEYNYIRILFLNIDKAFKWKPENPVTVTKHTSFIYNYRGNKSDQSVRD